MAQTMWDTATRASIVARVKELSPDAKARWGRMSAPRMMAHLNDALRMALGELAVKRKNLPIRYFPLKQLFVYTLPFPRGAPTAPELIARVPGAWNVEVSDFGSGVERLATREHLTLWPDHPAFGALTPRAWGTLVYRHTDHHLRQFGA